MKKYATPQAFLAGLEATLRKRTGTAPLAFERRRQTLAFDRLLVRLVQHFGDRVLLKGGFALELRLDTARATRDIDLRMLGQLRTLPDELTMACRLDVGDWFTFTVRPHKTPNVAGARTTARASWCRRRLPARISPTPSASMSPLAMC